LRQVINFNIKMCLSGETECGAQGIKVAKVSIDKKYDFVLVAGNKTAVVSGRRAVPPSARPRPLTQGIVFFRFALAWFMTTPE
jgi:hypothetical protein